MTRTILITSGKGGVGKTTLVSNLAAALTELGQDVTAVDANLTTPNLGLHLGFHLTANTLHDVLRGDVRLPYATYMHPLGFKVIPASMRVDDLTGVDPSKLSDVVLNLLGKTDFIIMDSSAGLGREAISAIQAADEIILITNPDLPSVADVLKTAKLAEQSEKKILGVVVNRVENKWHELSTSEIEEVLGTKVLAEIPEDNAVAKSITIKIPAVVYQPESAVALEIRQLAHQLVGRPFKRKRPKIGLLERFTNWLSR